MPVGESTHEAEIQEGVLHSNLASVPLYDASGASVIPGTLTSFELNIYERGSATAIYTVSGVGSDTNPDGSTVYSSSLRTGAIWSKNSDGYNFRHQPIQAAVDLLEGGKSYSLEYVLNFAGTNVKLDWIWRVASGKRF